MRDSTVLIKAVTRPKVDHDHVDQHSGHREASFSYMRGAVR